MTMSEVADAADMIEDAADEDAHIIFGYVTLDDPCDEVKCTVIATGFQQPEVNVQPQQRMSYVPTTRSVYGDTGSINVPARSSIPAPGQRETVEQVKVGSARSSVVRSSVVENHLDIPAFIRRQKD